MVPSAANGIGARVLFREYGMLRIAEVAIVKVTPMLLSGVSARVQVPTQSAARAQTLLLYRLGLDARRDGWSAAPASSIIGSRERKLGIVSFMARAMRRTLWGIDVSLMAPRKMLSILGVVRAPQYPTQRNANGFDVRIYDLSLDEVPNSDTRHSPKRFNIEPRHSDILRQDST